MKFYNYKSDYYYYVIELRWTVDNVTTVRTIEFRSTPGVGFDIAQKELFDYCDNLIKDNPEYSTMNDIKVIVKSAKLYEPEDGEGPFIV